MGQHQRSNEILIGTNAGVVKAFAIKRKPQEERWCKESVEAMQGSPQQPAPGIMGREIPVVIHVDREEPNEEWEEVQPRTEQVPRRMQLRKRHFREHGYTAECAGCKNMQAGIAMRIHSEVCRKRMHEALSQTHAGKIWIETSRIRE